MLVSCKYDSPPSNELGNRMVPHYQERSNVISNLYLSFFHDFSGREWREMNPVILFVFLSCDHDFCGQFHLNYFNYFN